MAKGGRKKRQTAMHIGFVNFWLQNFVEFKMKKKLIPKLTFEVTATGLKLVFGNLGPKDINAYRQNPSSKKT